MRALRERVDRYSVTWLTAAWVLLWGDLTWLNVVGGVIIAVTLCVLFPMPRLHVPITVRPGPALRLLATFVVDLVVASVHVALVATAPGTRRGGSLVEVTLHSREQFFVTTTAGLTTLVPGSVVIDVDRANGTLLLHALHVFTREEQDMLRERVRAQEARLLRAFDKHCDATLAGPVGGPLVDHEIAPEAQR